MDTLSFILGALGSSLSIWLGWRHSLHFSLPQLSGIPKSYREVNRIWMTQALHRLGYGCRHFLDIRIQPWMTSDSSVLIRAKLSHVELAEANHHQFLIKVACNQPEPDKIVMERRKNEVRFSKLVKQHQHSLPIAQILDADIADSGRYFYLIMEDLSESHFTSVRPLPPKVEQSQQNILAFAQFHAYWWNKPERLTLVTHTSTDEIRRHYEACLSRFLQEASGYLSQQARDAFSWFAKHISQVLETSCARHLTLVHGDAHPWNCLNPSHDTKGCQGAKLIDWETAANGSCTNDLIRQIVCVWHQPERRQKEAMLLPFYHACLIAHGVQGYTYEDLLRDYRIGMAENLILPALMHERGKSPQTWWRYSELLAQAFVDWQSSELFT